MDLEQGENAALCMKPQSNGDTDSKLCESKPWWRQHGVKRNFIALIMALSSILFLAGIGMGMKSLCQGDAARAKALGYGDQSPVSGRPEVDWAGNRRLIKGRHGAVASDHSRCSEMGVAILKSSGNAADATVTVALCEGLYNPMASGIGGGGFINVLSPDGSAEIIDAREFAPSGATEKMYKGNASLAVTGGLAIAVPLEMRGLQTFHQRHGKLPWADLVMPLVPIARDGFPAHPYIVKSLNSNYTQQRFSPGLRQAFMIAEGTTWRPPRVNETTGRRPQLAALLAEVAQYGADVMHVGPLAEKLAHDIQQAGGLVTVADLAAAQPQIKKAMRATAFGMELIFPPPPSAAAIIVTALHILEGYALRLPAAGTLGTHRMIEAMKHAFALRMTLGDPGSDPSNPYINATRQEALLHDIMSPKFAATLRSHILDNTTQEPQSYGGKWNVLQRPPQDAGTCHFNVVDKDGMAVAMTTTVNTPYGSGVYSESTGILLNNEMADFSTPEQADVFNLPPAEANFIRAGKKPLSSMSPMIVLREGKLRAVVGASGGPLILSAVYQTLLRLIAEGDKGIDVVAGPRFHHQLLPNNLYAENWKPSGVDLSLPSRELDQLRQRNHNITEFHWGADTQAIITDPDNTRRLTALSDLRKDGAPAAY